MAYIKKTLSQTQIYGSGLAAILLSLVLYLLTRIELFLFVSLGLTILLMIWPRPFMYFGFVWFAFGEMIGWVISRLLLSLIYFILVIPIGLIVRKKIRRNMQLSSFGKDSGSVFRQRDHDFIAKDFEKPF